MESKTYTYEELEQLFEAELELIAKSKKAGNNDARYILGKQLCEGTNDKVTKNIKKGMYNINIAAENGHTAALEFKTYWDIRFDKSPKLDNIKANLLKIISENKSTRACNTIAELNHASAG